MPSCILTTQRIFQTRDTLKRDTFLLDIELMLGNLIATAATGAFLITSRRGRPLGGHLYVQVAAVVGPQHGRRRRRVGRGRATIGAGGVNHRHDQRLADVESRRGQIVDGAVFAQHVDLFGRPTGHRIGHAEIVRFVGTSGPRIVQVIVLSVFWGGTKSKC